MYDDDDGDPWDETDDGHGNAVQPGAEDEPDSVFPDPAFADMVDVDAWRRAVRMTWAAYPWASSTRYVYAYGMLMEGAIPIPPDLTPKQLDIFGTTHKLMCTSALEILGIVGDDMVWRTVLRAGVCERILSAPGESAVIAVINAMRGERKELGKPVVKLWEQLSYPAGVAEAALAALGKVQGIDVAYYRDTLLRLLPSLRRTTKPSQEPRQGRRGIKCAG